MFDLASRFQSDPGCPDLYEEEAEAAFRRQAEEAINQYREDGDVNPVILLLHPDSRYAGHLVSRLTVLVRQGQVVEVPHFAEDVRAFVLPRSQATRLLQPLGRTVWGLDFALHLGQRLDGEQFFEVSMWGGKVLIRHCWPGPLTVA